MNINDYQKAATQTSLVKGKQDELYYLALGLVNEAGEVAGKIKKIIRDQNGDMSADNKTEIAKEIGDVLWYAANLSDFLGVPLEDIAEGNIDKLASRKERGVISGSGDNR